MAVASLRASLSERAGMSFGELLEWHLSVRGTRPDGRKEIWSKKAFSDAIQSSGKSRKSLDNWLSDRKPPSQYYFTTLSRILFGTNLTLEEFRQEFQERWLDTKRLRPRNNRVVARPSRPKSASPTSERLLSYAELDDLPVDARWTFQNVQYGEEPQVRTIEGIHLFWLPAETRLLDPSGSRRDPTAFFLNDNDSFENIIHGKEVFFPYKITVTGTKRDRNWAIMLHACSDLPYPSEVDDSAGDGFCIKDCAIGMSGITAFVDRFGNLRPRSIYEIGGERGCVVALSAVAYLRGVPQCRSRYFLAIRKGIRYPDDVWLSKRTGKPICPHEGDIARQRFVFQSRETKGGSTDIFVADYNGARMCNITAQDPCAWDGFEDDAGVEVVRWTEAGEVEFFSRATGYGYAELITRPDPFSISPAA